MGKFLAAGGVVVLVLLILLWYQMQSTGAVAAPSAKPVPVAEQAAPAKTAPLTQALATAAAATAQSGKIDIASDAFFNQFTDKIPSLLSGNAIRKCYAGAGLHRRGRDAFLTLEFIDHIKNGEVTVSDVKVKTSQLGDPALESCMIAAVAATHWHDDSLPDTSQSDEVTINPERIVKKYVDDSYEGAPAPDNTPR